MALSQNWSALSRTFSQQYIDLDQSLSASEMIEWGSGKTWDDATNIRWGTSQSGRTLGQGWTDVSR